MVTTKAICLEQIVQIWDDELQNPFSIPLEQNGTSWLGTLNPKPNLNHWVASRRGHILGGFNLEIIKINNVFVRRSNFL